VCFTISTSGRRTKQSNQSTMDLIALSERLSMTEEKHPGIRSKPNGYNYW
jgi:hypothetical protein